MGIPLWKSGGMEGRAWGGLERLHGDGEWARNGAMGMGNTLGMAICQDSANPGKTKSG